MLNCKKCGLEIHEEDVYMVNGEELCEDCAMSKGGQSSPSKPCGTGSGK